ncbi:hypothetical protein NC651_034579 [Populus alba x Populus x berolinensis]|nr:hypothetical protein NC651_034579 [Populus alba x Populus x berolinensis]
MMEQRLRSLFSHVSVTYQVPVSIKAHRRVPNWSEFPQESSYINCSKTLTRQSSSTGKFSAVNRLTVSAADQNSKPETTTLSSKEDEDTSFRPPPSNALIETQMG